MLDEVGRKKQRDYGAKGTTLFPLKPGGRKFARYLLSGIIGLAAATPVLAWAVDHSLFEELLGNHVKEVHLDYDWSLNGK